MGIKYTEFEERFAPYLWPGLSRLARTVVLLRAWEECSWISTLTDQRGKQALEDAMRFEVPEADPSSLTT